MVDTTRFEEVRVKDVSGQWSTMTPGEFQKIPLPQRVQLLLRKQIRFFAKGVEVKALDALMD
jgi:hypothetical protein